MKATDHAQMPDGEFRRRVVAVAHLQGPGITKQTLQVSVDSEATLLGFRRDERFNFRRDVQAYKSCSNT
jgi:hypothetical protein